MDTTIMPPDSRNIEDVVFDAALSLEDEREREAFLEKFFRNDPAGLSRMRRLIELSGESSAFFLDVSEHGSVLARDILESNPEETTVPQTGEPVIEEPGAKIGPYVLIARIGEGGCGIVYEAEQQEPVQRRVALKIIRLGMDTESVIARFAVERQALALMDHPNIAHVYDAGATAKGRPYFVMERVSGERITTFCDQKRLGIVDRIHLFIQVCQAIQHAHQKGVVHRDIKPSNILVTTCDGAPMPKVIDFGIAKATGPADNFLQTPKTKLDQIVGTPPYMSPEQVDMRGIDVDTRSDVYSLGALLYELLGGRPPFDEATLARAGITEMRRTLMEVEPPPLSRMLAGLPKDELAKVASARGEHPSRLPHRLRGDLDWIVAMALSKDRNRRYQTVNALTAELRRFLANEPVIARRPSRLYLLGKFIRRNRIACGLGTAVAISLLGGLGVSTMLYIRERAALAEQERLGRVEQWLHEQAQARANVSLAAVLLSEGKIEEADNLLRESPLESIEPSREAAGVFRVLGEWNAYYQRWPQALQSFLLLDQANQLDNPVTIVEHMDLLEIAPAMVKGGDDEAYDKFRRKTLDRHLPATNSLQAEHLLKICLLTPAGDQLLRRLAPVAEVCQKGVQEGNHLHHPGWEAFSMALYHFRRDDRPRTLEWAKKTLTYGPNPSRAAPTLCLMAMTKFRSGQVSEALADLKNAEQIVHSNARYAPSEKDGLRGSWYAWAVAEILLDEASRLIKPGHLETAPAG